MSLDDRRQAELSRKASDAEKSLVLRHFREAEKISLGLLQNAVYLPKVKVEQQRAACVYLQAIYEDNRFHEGLATLVENYGRLDAVDFDVFLLWVALALDADLAQEAVSKLQQYIQLRTSSRSAAPEALTSDELDAAARMYALEALAGGLGRPQEAQQWVRERTPWLEPGQRQRILDELLQAPSQQSTAESLPTLQPATPVHSEPAKSWGSPRFTQPQGSLHAWEPRDGSAAVNSAEQSAPGAGVGQQPSAGPKDTDTALRRQSELPASSASLSASASDWGTYLPQSVREAWRSMHNGGGAAGLTQTHLLATAAGAAVLLYAGMAERRAVYCGIRRFGGVVWGSVAEVARAALQLNPNPVAASMATRRL